MMLRCKGLLVVLGLLAGVGSGRCQIPDVVINNVTGSDTAASGAPSAFGPFSAAATCDTNGVATTVIDWPANPLAGVPVDGSAVLWLATASGRRWSVITARAAGTVTVADSFNIPGGTPVDCAVGGQRATLGASRLLEDAKAGWAYAVENTGVDYTITAAIVRPVLSSGVRYYVRGTGAARPRIVQTSNASFISGPHTLTLANLVIENTNATKTSPAIAGAVAGNECITLRDLLFIGWQQVSSGTLCGLVYNVEARAGAVNGFGSTTQNSVLFLGNYLHDNTGNGFQTSDRSFFLYNIAADNTADGFQCATCNWFHNTSYSNGGDGFDYGNIATAWVVGNLSTDNTGVGLRNTGGPATPVKAIVNNNAYFNNTGGAYSATAPVGANDLTVVNPLYAGVPTNLQPLAAAFLGAGFPLNTLPAGSQSTTFTFTEPGASQRSGGGGGNHAY